jgi:hypothetical protein
MHEGGEIRAERAQGVRERPGPGITLDDDAGDRARGDDPLGITLDDDAGDRARGDDPRSAPTGSTGSLGAGRVANAQRRGRHR